MRSLRHKNLWLSNSNGYCVSWQHDKYVGWRVGDSPTPPQPIIINTPNTIGIYKVAPQQDFYVFNPYFEDLPDYRRPLKNIQVVNNNTTLTYYIIDKNSLSGEDNNKTPFVPQFEHITGRVFDNTQINTTNGLIDYTNKKVNIYANFAFAIISPVIKDIQDESGKLVIPDSEVATYKEFLRIPDNYFDYYDSSYFPEYYYKVQTNGWTDRVLGSAIADKPTDLFDSISTYGGYDYGLTRYKFNPVNPWQAKTVRMSGIPRVFLAIPWFYSEGDVIWRRYITAGLINPMGGDWYPSNYNNTPYVIPDLPIMGGQHPYEYQTIVLVQFSNLYHVWGHILTRYWFNPTN